MSPKEIQSNHLKSIPVGWVMSNSYAQSTEPSDAQWRLPAPKVPLFIRQELEPSVCQAFNNRAYGIDGVLRDMRSALVAQCFGPKNTFTVAVSKGAASFVDMPPATTLPFSPNPAPVPDPSDTDAWEIPPGTTVAGGGSSPLDPPAGIPGVLTVSPHFLPDGFYDPNMDYFPDPDLPARVDDFTLAFLGGEYFYQVLNNDHYGDLFLVENRTSEPIELLPLQTGYLFDSYSGAPADLGGGYSFCDFDGGQVLQPGQGCIAESSRYTVCEGDTGDPVEVERLSSATVMNLVPGTRVCAPDPEPGYLVINPSGSFNVGYLAPLTQTTQEVTLSNPAQSYSSVSVSSISTSGSRVQLLSENCPGWDIDPMGVDGARTPIVLAPGASCEVTLRLTAVPGEVESFNFGDVYFDWDNGDYTAYASLTLSGATIVPTPVNPTLKQTPSGDPWNVGFVGLGLGALTQNSVWVNVTNQGSNPLTISELQLVAGPHGSLQIIDRYSCAGSPPYTLAKDQECAFRVAAVAPADLQFPYTPNANFGTFRVISNTDGAPANETVIVGSTGNTLFMPSNPVELQNGKTPLAYKKIAVGVPVEIDLLRYLGGYLVPPGNESLVSQENRLDGGRVSPSAVTWSFPSASLPAGLTFDPETGLITGTPTSEEANLELPFTATYNPYALYGSEGVGQVSGTFNLTVLPMPYLDMTVISKPGADLTPDGLLEATFSGPLMETWNNTRFVLNWGCRLSITSAQGPSYFGTYYIPRLFGQPTVELLDPRASDYGNAADPVFDTAVLATYQGMMQSFEGTHPAGTWEGANFMSCTDGVVSLNRTPAAFPGATPVNQTSVQFTPPLIPSGGTKCLRFGPDGQHIGDC